ncbi:cytoglobin-2-like [Actinia tenebrosa]|uniref:Cytoglobin-2-like n=1 Tax=Actinia tenebrosa TaxID=6105 RepID=A0A2K9UYQ9_ACTTE|nr:cytoglobin-2-like [Actinia tenebrosa]AUV50076.1 globin-like protein [Actinia tenebrosa]
MGCSSSIDVNPAHRKAHIDIFKMAKSCELSYEQKYLIRETWKFLEVSKREIGISVYKRFLTMHPELKQYFTEFKNIDIGHINGTHGHPKRLLMAIDNAVTAMGDSESFSAYLVELGRRHNMPHLRPSHVHFNDLRKCFLSVIMEVLDSATFWNSEVEKAWNQLFDSIAIMMLKGLEMSEGT